MLAGPARARQDDVPHHPLHGGGRTAGRPDRGDRRRRDRRRRHPADDRRPRPHDAEIPFTLPDELRHATYRPTCSPCLTARSTAARCGCGASPPLPDLQRLRHLADGRRAEIADLEVPPSQPRGGLPRPDRARRPRPRRATEGTSMNLRPPHHPLRPASPSSATRWAAC